MSVKPLAEAVDRKLLSVSDDLGQHADDMAVTNTFFDPKPVIAADKIVIFAHLDDAMQHILAGIALVQRDIQPLQRQLWTLDHKQITRLDQRIHAVADVGIDQLAALRYDLFEAGFSHRSHR